MSSRYPLRVDVLLGVALAAAGLYIAFESARFPKIPAQAYGPGFFPQLVGYLLSASGVLTAARALARHIRRGKADPSVGDDRTRGHEASAARAGTSGRHTPNWAAIVWVLAGLAGIAWAMNTVGFLILVPVFLLGYLYLVGEPSVRSLLVVAASTTAAWYGFAVLLKVQIPPGLLELLR